MGANFCTGKTHMDQWSDMGTNHYLNWTRYNFASFESIPFMTQVIVSWNDSNQFTTRVKNRRSWIDYWFSSGLYAYAKSVLLNLPGSVQSIESPIVWEEERSGSRSYPAEIRAGPLARGLSPGCAWMVRFSGLACLLDRGGVGVT